MKRNPNGCWTAFPFPVIKNQNIDFKRYTIFLQSKTQFLTYLKKATMAPKKKTAGTKGKKGTNDGGEKEMVTKATRASSGKVVSSPKQPPNSGNVDVQIQNPVLPAKPSAHVDVVFQNSVPPDKGSAHVEVAIQNPSDSPASVTPAKEPVSLVEYSFLFFKHAHVF